MEKLQKELAKTEGMYSDDNKRLEGFIYEIFEKGNRHFSIPDTRD